MKHVIRINWVILMLAMASPLRSEIILNEVSVQDADYVELFNFGNQAINIQGYELEFFSAGSASFIFTLPDRILLPNTGVLEVSDSAVPETNRIFVGGDIDWNSMADAAVFLRNPGGDVVDYWIYDADGSGISVMGSFPSPFVFMTYHLPAIGNLIETHQRSSSLGSSSEFLKNNWILRSPSRGTENVDNLSFQPFLATPGPQIIINEVSPNTPDFIELFNHGCEPINLEGFRLDIHSEYETDFSFTFPDIEMLPNQNVIAATDSISDAGPVNFFVGQNINWISAGGLAVVLRDDQGTIIDFMRVGSDLISVLPGQLRMLPAQIVPANAPAVSYQRQARRTRGNEYFTSDWAVVASSQGAENTNQLQYPDPQPGCEDSVLDFLPAIITGAIDD